MYVKKNDMIHVALAQPLYLFSEASSRFWFHKISMSINIVLRYEPLQISACYKGAHWQGVQDNQLPHNLRGRSLDLEMTPGMEDNYFDDWRRDAIWKEHAWSRYQDEGPWRKISEEILFEKYLRYTQSRWWYICSYLLTSTPSKHLRPVSMVFRLHRMVAANLCHLAASSRSFVNPISFLPEWWDVRTDYELRTEPPILARLHCVDLSEGV